jgi:peptide/nickel transport system substrate-binding protein/oligopeptide transport system substrate-binding protein
MRAAPRIAGWLLALFAALTLAACDTGDDSTARIVAIGDKGDPFRLGARLPFAAQLVRAATAEGLVAFDEQGRVVPALADRWIVTDDGRSYIFRLRDGTWRSGSALSAAAAQTALRNAIAGLKGSALGLDLAGVDEIRAMAGRVIEIRLSQPMPHLLQLLAQPELGLLRKREGAGPMRLRRENDVAVLTPIKPEALGLPTVPKFDERARTIRLSALPSEAAVARFNNGDADVLLGGKIEDFPLASSVGILRGTIQLDPVIGLFGLAVMRGDGFLASAENREAIAMAIDRDGLIAAFGVSGWTPSTRIVGAGLEGDLGTIGERWTALDLAQRRALARARVARWHEGQAATLRLRIALPEGPGADLLFTRLKQDLAAIGIDAVRVGEAETTDLRLVDDIARYPQAMWFLNRFNCRVQRGLCNQAADDRAAEARDAQDTATRSALLAEAEAELTAANVFIPFGAPIRWSLVRSDAIGFAPNRWGWHPLMPMALRPK